MKKNYANRKVAIFDIDGTIFRSSLLIELVESFIAKGIFPKKSRAMYEREFKRWLNREGTYEDYIEGVIVAFMKHIKALITKISSAPGSRSSRRINIKFIASLATW